MAATSQEKDAESVQHMETSIPQKLEAQEEDPNYDPVYSYKQQRRIIRKIDLRLLPALGLMFGISIVDRVNIGNAMIAGMREDLQLNVGTRYSVALLVFFGSYVLCMWPSAMIFPKLGPRVYLSGITISWGIVTIVSLLPVTHETLLLTSLQVIRIHEMYKRYSVFYLIHNLVGAFAGLLAFGFMQMGGLQGHAPWRWIFIMEGLLTCLIGVFGHIALVGHRKDAHKAWKFLSPSEIDFVNRHISKDAGAQQDEPFSFGAFFKTALDPIVWAYSLMFCCTTTVSYAIAFFLPIILRDYLKFSLGAAQALVTPPYILASITMYVQGWLSDKYRLRSPIVVVNCLAAILGFCLLAWVPSPGVQYLGTFFILSGSQSTMATLMAWQTNNVRGQWKRSFCSASLVSFGGIGGVMGALVFRSQDAPEYYPGIYTALVCQGVNLVIVTVLVLYFKRANRQADANGRIIEGLASFRYTL
ncbi:predicted protein [Uncinocarpus reesii 1704]|uniref:Major facilitator superfamily (MFS) profile domain-containing protein n=1 Tax=Uncinocarpus reesii (strain UAMH 1704) TaxID=336963 RepID=C4JKA4_UNCRE|nr:uncharacterized protein UREG_02061 [Uncinocarpus reesii 1704]EEP77212.1 predicted protein [Uncinocarpus reesii 1704]